MSGNELQQPGTPSNNSAESENSNSGGENVMLPENVQEPERAETVISSAGENRSLAESGNDESFLDIEMQLKKFSQECKEARSNMEYMEGVTNACRESLSNVKTRVAIIKSNVAPILELFSSLETNMDRMMQEQEQLLESVNEIEAENRSFETSKEDNGEFTSPKKQTKLERGLYGDDADVTALMYETNPDEWKTVVPKTLKMKDPKTKVPPPKPYERKPYQVQHQRQKSHFVKKPVEADVLLPYHPGASTSNIDPERSYSSVVCPTASTVRIPTEPPNVQPEAAVQPNVQPEASVQLNVQPEASAQPENVVEPAVEAIPERLALSEREMEIFHNPPQMNPFIAAYRKQFNKDKNTTRNADACEKYRPRVEEYLEREARRRDPQHGRVRGEYMLEYREFLDRQVAVNSDQAWPTEKTKQFFLARAAANEPIRSETGAVLYMLAQYDSPILNLDAFALYMSHQRAEEFCDPDDMYTQLVLDQEGQVF